MQYGIPLLFIILLLAKDLWMLMEELLFGNQKAIYALNWYTIPMAVLVWVHYSQKRVPIDEVSGAIYKVKSNVI